MTKQPEKRHALQALIWLPYMLISVWLALAGAWWLYGSQDYGYRYWYQHMDIDGHIRTYAPAHPYKGGFESLSAQQYEALFGQIVDAVHNHGKGLSAIVYRSPEGRSVALLDRQERQHLQDVANLLDAAKQLSFWLLPLFFVFGWLVRRYGPPTWIIKGAALLFLAVAAGAPLLLFGPTEVFYQFHHWLFPPEHPWFFYWQESLMSTLMKAPNLFAGIALVIGVLALLWLPLLYWLGQQPVRAFQYWGLRAKH